MRKLRTIKLLGTLLKLEHWMLIKNLSEKYIVAVAVLIFLDVAIFTFVDYGYKSADFSGCYAYDAMLVGYECTGFLGAEIVGLALNLPLYHLYMPFFVLFNPLMIFAVIAIWFFPVMFVISSNKLKRKST